MFNIINYLVGHVELDHFTASYFANIGNVDLNLNHLTRLDCGGLYLRHIYNVVGCVRIICRSMLANFHSSYQETMLVQSACDYCSNIYG